MNLIEQLGGYEKAKEYLVGLQRTPMHEQTEDTISYLPDALIEYRRQHNIFEVGDKVIHVDIERSNHVFEVYFVRANSGNQYVSARTVIKVIDLTDMTERHFYNSGFNTSPEIRHATDEEIKAGKRLEVNQ